MSTDKMTIEDKKYLAKTLYTREQLDGKLVAQRVGISETTMSKWVNEYNWKALRNRLLISKEQQINLLYEQLEALNSAIQKGEEGYANTKQADILVKYAAAIRSLETDLAIGDLVEAGMRFIKWLQKTGSFKQTVELSDLWNAFIQSSIKR